MIIDKLNVIQENPVTSDTILSDINNSEPKSNYVRKGNKQQISLTIVPELLHKIDRLAMDLGQSRAAVINLAIYRAVEYGLLKD